MPSNALSTLNKARQLLQQCSSVDEAKGIRDKAEAVRVYVKQQGESLSAQNHAAEIKLRAERRAGELLAAMEKQNGSRGVGKKAGLHDETPLLADLGITKTQSHRWQTEAALPRSEFEKYVAATTGSNSELTSRSLYQLGRKHKAGATSTVVMACEADFSKAKIIDNLGEVGAEKFGTVYADPPWQYGNQSTRAATDGHYGTMPLQEICDLPVCDIVADDAHLHLWTTNAFLFDARQVMEAWGFEYRSCFIWVKPQMGIGNYWRVSHEFLLLGIRGNAKRFNDRSLKSWGEFDRTKHSAKPEQIRAYVESASPGPYLEMFGRGEMSGWTVFGNQVERKLFA